MINARANAPGRINMGPSQEDAGMNVNQVLASRRRSRHIDVTVWLVSRSMHKCSVPSPKNLNIWFQ